MDLSLLLNGYSDIMDKYYIFPRGTIINDSPNYRYMQSQTERLSNTNKPTYPQNDILIEPITSNPLDYVYISASQKNIELIPKNPYLENHILINREPNDLVVNTLKRSYNAIYRDEYGYFDKNTNDGSLSKYQRLVQLNEPKTITTNNENVKIKPPIPVMFKPIPHKFVNIQSEKTSNGVEFNTSTTSDNNIVVDTSTTSEKQLSKNILFDINTISKDEPIAPITIIQHEKVSTNKEILPITEVSTSLVSTPPPLQTPSSSSLPIAPPPPPPLPTNLLEIPKKLVINNTPNDNKPSNNNKTTSFTVTQDLLEKQRAKLQNPANRPIRVKPTSTIQFATNKKNLVDSQTSSDNLVGILRNQINKRYESIHGKPSRRKRNRKSVFNGEANNRELELPSTNNHEVTVTETDNSDSDSDHNRAFEEDEKDYNEQLHFNR